MTTRTWLDRLAHELAARGVGAEQVAAIVVEAQAHLEEAGEAPLAVFGPPDAYADDVAAVMAPADGPRRSPGRARVTAAEVRKTYGGRTVLDGVTVRARAGEAVLVIGPNGSGKSTLLRILAGLAACDGGRVEVAGSVGYAPQHGGLVAHLRPDEHFVLFGRARGLARATAVREGRRVAEQLGWDAGAAPVARQLSGGTRQKLNVALAALGDPDVLLLDEPYQGLDRDSMERFWDLLEAWREAGRAAVVVSHAPDAVRHADAVVELAGPGAPR